MILPVLLTVILRRSEADAAPPPETFYMDVEDDSGDILLEDGVSKFLQE